MHSREESLIIFGIVAHDVELVGELREIRFQSLARLGKGFVERLPVLLVISVRHFKLYVRTLEQIVLDLCAEVCLVADNRAGEIVLSDIIQVFDVVDTGLGHVIGMDHARYPADSMQLVAKVIQGLGGAIAEVWSFLGASLAHRVTVAS